MTGKTNPAPVLSEDSVIVWLEQQPPDRDYYWPDCKRCGAAQYCIAHGIPIDRMHEIPNWTAIFMGDSPFRWTMGAALERARALQGAGL